MKRSTCKILLWIGILWVALFLLIISLRIIPGLIYGFGSFGLASLIGLIFGLIVFCFPAWILILIAVTKWNSEQEKAETLKSRAKVHVHVQAKMEDIESGSNFCSDCGAKMKPNAKHCSKCGAKQ